MRIKTRFEFTHFGIKFRTNKSGKLSLDSFLEKDATRLTTNEFFWSLRYKELYKLFPKEDVLKYFNCLKNEAENRKPFADTDMILYWCRTAIEFFARSDYKRLQSAYRKKYYKESAFLKKYTYEEYLNVYLPGNWKQRLSLYDFSESYYKSYYSEKWYELIKNQLIRNFEANRKHFNLLFKNDFEVAIDTFLNQYQFFTEVHDLNDSIYEQAGYYLLVLDEYKQIYIGMAKDIKKRILDHFKKNVKYDRRIFGEAKESKISIDSFGCFDVTRIFVGFDSLVNIGLTHEDELINAFDNKYVTNRIMGDEMPIGLSGVEPKRITY